MASASAEVGLSATSSSTGSRVAPSITVTTSSVTKGSSSNKGSNHTTKVVVGSKEALDSSVTSSGDATTTGDSTNNPNSISRHRREVLIRQPSYCKILDDLQGTEERVLKLANKMPTKGQQNVLEVSTTEDDGADDGSPASSPSGGVVSSAVAGGTSQAVQTISINGQQYQIVSPAPIDGIQTINVGGGSSGSSGVLQYAATTQNGQTIFLPGTAQQVVTVGSAAVGAGSSSSGGSVSLANVPGTSGMGLLSSGSHHGPEEASRKREIRLLKNREAARECRNKKKEYIKCLENRVAVLENQNKALIEELKSLKELYTGQKS